MAWELPNSFRRGFKTSTSHQLSFTTQFQKDQKSWLIKNCYIKNNQNKRKTTTRVLACKGKYWLSIKSRGTLKMICDVSILLRNTIKHIFPCPL